jgi:hypothetical protein
MDDVPNEVFVRIAKQALGGRPSFPLVCRRWRAIWDLVSVVPPVLLQYQPSHRTVPGKDVVAALQALNSKTKVGRVTHDLDEGIALNLLEPLWRMEQPYFQRMEPLCTLLLRSCLSKVTSRRLKHYFVECASMGWLDCTNLLLTDDRCKGANLNLALKRASKCGHTEVALVLIEAIKSRDDFLWDTERGVPHKYPGALVYDCFLRCMRFAIIQSDQRLLDALLSSGADFRWQWKKPLFLANRRSNWVALKSLLDCHSLSGTCASHWYYRSRSRSEDE